MCSWFMDRTDCNDTLPASSQYFTIEHADCCIQVCDIAGCQVFDLSKVVFFTCFSNTFTKVKNISDKIWKFHRYSMIVEYEFRPILPPPLIILNYIPMIFRQFFKKRKNAIFNSDRGLSMMILICF